MRTLTFILMLAGITACYRGGESYVIYLRYNALVSSLQQCKPKPSTNEARPEGVLDVSMTNRYYLSPVAVNLLDPLANLSTTKGLYTENHYVQLSGIRVTYTFNENTPLSDKLKDALEETYYFPASGSIAPGEEWVKIIMAISPEVGNLLKEEIDKLDVGAGFQIIVKAQLEGFTQDGQDVASNEMTLPVEVCSGCLVLQISNDCTDLEKAQGMELPCIIGQDDGVDCRFLYMMGYENIPEPIF